MNRLMRLRAELVDACPPVSWQQMQAPVMWSRGLAR